LAVLIGRERARHPAHQALADPHPRDVHGLGRKTLRGAQLQRVGVAQQVDRAHLGAHRIRDQMRDAVQPLLPSTGSAMTACKRDRSLRLSLSLCWTIDP
jgi:hypothetical protein